MTTYYVEVRSSVRRRGPPKLVPLDEVARHTGFRSAFCFDAETAELIRTQGGTQDLRGRAVYADTLFVDFDNSDGSLAIAYLDAQGIAYQKWHSGGRSIHLHIPLQPIYGEWVPLAVKTWTKQFAPDADISFLHPAGMYRLPGTYHVKYPGKCKTLLHQQAGASLVLTEPAGTSVSYGPIAGGEATREDFFTLLLQPAHPGQRRPMMWLLAVTGFEAGMTHDEILQALSWWNTKMCSEPHDIETIERQIDSAYRRALRRL